MSKIHMHSGKKNSKEIEKKSTILKMSKSFILHINNSKIFLKIRKKTIVQ